MSQPDVTKIKEAALFTCVGLAGSAVIVLGALGGWIGEGAWIDLSAPPGSWGRVVFGLAVLGAIGAVVLAGAWRDAVEMWRKGGED